MKAVLTSAHKFHDDIKERIASLGYEVIDHGSENDEFTEEEYLCDVVVGLNPFMKSKVEKFKNLRFFQATSAGFDTIPVDKLKEKGIAFSNARDVYSVPIAEFTIMRILEIYKKSFMYFTQQKESLWNRDFRLQELTDKRAAILGTGSIGVQIAKRLKAFDAVTIGFNRSGREAEYFDEIYKIELFEENADKFDIIICALPLNDGSVHIIDKNILNKMNGKSVLVNIGRGQSVDTEALYDVLKERKIMGAALDVFENEPLEKDSKLWKLDNLLISPHICSGSNYMNKRVYDLVYENLKAFINKEELKNRII